MRWIYMIPYAFLCVTLVSCEETLMEPVPEGLSTPSFTVTHNEWVEPFPLDGTFDYVECANDGAGEILDWGGVIDLYYRSKITPSGNEVWHWKADYATETPASLTGRESGDFWQNIGSEDTGGFVSKPQGTQYVEHWQGNERYVNEDGERIHLRAQFKLIINADGEAQAERFVWNFKCFK